MIALGIEASPREGSVALLRADQGSPVPSSAAWIAEVVAVERIPHEQGAARALAPAIEAVALRSGVELSALDLVAVGLGPGGYTGTRLAVATARALGFALGVPVVGIVSTLAIAADPRVPSGEVLVALDAKNGDVYAARYRKLADGVSIDEVRAPFVATAEEVIGDDRDSAFIAGDGMTVLAGVAASSGRTLRGDVSIYAIAEHVAALGIRRFQGGARDSPSDLLPLYLRPSAAERLWEAKQAASRAQGAR